MSASGPLLAASLRALGRWQPSIAEEVSATPPDPRIIPIEGKDGTPSIAARETATSSCIQLHSRYVPLREAERLVAAFDRVASLVHLGCGGLHVPQVFLRSHRHGVVLVVEPAPGVIRSVLSHIDVVAHIESGRLRFALDESHIADELQRLHQPMIRDGIRFTDTAPWIDWEPQRSRFVQLRQRLDRVTREIAADHASVAAFGRRWLAHTVENSLRIDWSTVPSIIDRFRRRIAGADIRVYGAGPSLDRFFATDEGDAHVGIIVDTATPAFAARRRREYAVVVLDPQGWESPSCSRTQGTPVSRGNGGGGSGRRAPALSPSAPRLYRWGVTIRCTSSSPGRVSPFSPAPRRRTLRSPPWRSRRPMTRRRSTWLARISDIPTARPTRGVRTITVSRMGVQRG